MGATGTSTSSSADIIKDIVRLIAPGDREGFHEMLQHELRSFCEPLPDGEMRRIAVNTWRAFCKYGWPRDT
jgi:hypothetical protein